jgi:hypothetical protein
LEPATREERCVQALGADLVIPLLALAFAAYFFIDIRDLAWEAKANGVIIGTLLLILLAVQFARIGVAIARGRGDWRMDPLWQPRDALGKRIGMVLMTIAFIATIKWLGLTLGLLLGMLGSLWIMGVRRPKPLLGIAFAVAAAAYALFIATINSDFPHGPVEQLLAGAFK